VKIAIYKDISLNGFVWYDFHNVVHSIIAGKIAFIHLK